MRSSISSSSLPTGVSARSLYDRAAIGAPVRGLPWRVACPQALGCSPLFRHGLKFGEALALPMKAQGWYLRGQLPTPTADCITPRFAQVAWNFRPLAPQMWRALASLLRQALEELLRVAAHSLLRQAAEQVLACWRFERAPRWRPLTRIASASSDGLAFRVLSSPTSGKWRARR